MDEGASVPEWAADLPEPDDLVLTDSTDVEVAQAAYKGTDGDDSRVGDRADH